MVLEDTGATLLTNDAVRKAYLAAGKSPPTPPLLRNHGTIAAMVAQRSSFFTGASAASGGPWRASLPAGHTLITLARSPFLAAQPFTTSLAA